MTKIRVMSENLANKIAAGEVVEKCASVLKELVENAIDAESTNIKVILKDGGLKEISVIDNGIGMDKEDATLAFSMVINKIQIFLEPVFDAIVNETEWQENWGPTSSWCNDFK